MNSNRNYLVMPYLILGLFTALGALTAYGQDGYYPHCHDRDDTYWKRVQDRLPLYRGATFDSPVLVIIEAGSIVCASDLTSDFAKVRMYKNFRHWTFVSDVSDSEFGWAIRKDGDGDWKLQSELD